MNKEKLMQLLAESIDKNVSISLHFSQYQGENRVAVKRGEAHQLISQFAEALGNVSIKHNVGQPHADDYVIYSRNFRIVCSYIPTDEEKAEAKRKRIEQLKGELAELEQEEEALA